MAQNSERSASRRRGRGKPFQPGQSGNPGGRPKQNDEVQALARSHTKEATERLAFWMQSDNPKASVSACIALLDRGWGRPAQAVQVSGEGGGPVLTRVIHEEADV